MKLRKFVCVIVALAMIGTLAMSASAATITKPLVKVDWAIQQGVSGTEAGADSIDPELIKKVKVTFDAPDFDCMADPEKPCGKQCMTVAINSTATGWKDFKICHSENKVYEIDLATLNWPKMNGTDIADYLQVSATIWGFEGEGTVSVDIIGADGNSIALGTKKPAETTVAATNAPGVTTVASTTVAGGTTAKAATTTTVASSAKTNDGKLNTGAGGIALLGGVAVFAIGAIAISKKRK